MAEPHHRSPEPGGDDPLVGRVVDDRYRIVAPLGSGGMGRVYRAVQLQLDREIALKVLQVGSAVERDLGFVKRFCLEAAVTARLQHPNVVTLFDYGRTPDGLLFIAMEYLEGKTLGDVLAEEGALPPGRVIHIASQIARAIRDAHRMGLVHRDLKPSNVMLVSRDDEPDFVKVLDFGLARFFEVESELSQSGTFLGSPHYMAPEQARSEGATPQSDVYSLGVITYQMATGRLPFTADSSIAVLIEHARSQPKPPRLVDRRIPEALERAILTMMEKDRALRFASMDDVLAALWRASESMGEPPVLDAEAPPPEGGRIARAALLAGGAALLAAALAALLF